METSRSNLEFTYRFSTIGREPKLISLALFNLESIGYIFILYKPGILGFGSAYAGSLALMLEPGFRSRIM